MFKKEGRKMILMIEHIDQIIEKDKEGFEMLIKDIISQT